MRAPRLWKSAQGLVIPTDHHQSCPKRAREIARAPSFAPRIRLARPARCAAHRTPAEERPPAAAGSLRPHALRRRPADSLSTCLSLPRVPIVIDSGARSAESIGLGPTAGRRRRGPCPPGPNGSCGGAVRAAAISHARVSPSVSPPPSAAACRGARRRAQTADLAARQPGRRLAAPRRGPAPVLWARTLPNRRLILMQRGARSNG